MMNRVSGIPHSRSIRLLAAGLAAAGLLMAVTLVIVPAASPATGAQVADFLRSVVGPQPVAVLESASNAMRDAVNRYRFAGGHTQPQINWSVTGAASSSPSSGAIAATNRVASKANLETYRDSVVTVAPQIGWQAYGPTSSQGTPLLARAMLMADPQRSYAGVALVRIDLSQLQLHMMPGTIEPAHPSGIAQKIPSLGTVPLGDRNALVAAFNGGFKAVHGHYGMMVDGLTLLPAIDGMGTVAIYKDGSVRIGAWNQDISPSPDLIAYRQNCPPLIDGGVINPALKTDAERAWGFTNNSDISWRTGLGITQDGRYLIYAVGNGTNAEYLAEALQRAGAYAAIQLDINQYYAQFITYSQSASGMTAERLLDQMTANSKQFLTPDPRDFFYLTLR